MHAARWGDYYRCALLLSACLLELAASSPYTIARSSQRERERRRRPHTRLLHILLPMVANARRRGGGDHCGCWRRNFQLLNNQGNLLNNSDKEAKKQTGGFKQAIKHHFYEGRSAAGWSS